MITEIRYKNFKALRDTTLPLGRFTLIVGANGTGKTTALNSIQVLESPQKFLWNDISSVSANQDDIVRISFRIDDLDWSDEWNIKGHINQFENEDSEIYSILEESAKDFISEFRVFSFDSNKIAESASLSPNIRLSEDGKGLAGVLMRMQISEHQTFEKLNSDLRMWFPEFERVTFEIPEENRVSFLLETKNGRNKIKAKDLSDGTRLALAYLTLAYLPNPPKIVAFEEPERGIHPRLLENIQEAMYRLAYPENYGEKREPIQVIATTHSPYLLDLYKDFREEIVIASKDENGVHFERLSEMPNIDEIVQDAPLGEVWFTGVLGGVPAQL